MTICESPLALRLRRMLFYQWPLMALAFLITTTAYGNELIGLGSGSPLLSTEDTSPTGGGDGKRYLEAQDISQELLCSFIFSQATIADSGRSEKSRKELMRNIERFGEQFHEIWRKLERKGIPYPGPQERAHFYAQIFYESRDFDWLKERDPSKSKIKGGEKWAGRGPIQLTGCPLYAQFAEFAQNLERSESRGRKLFSYKIATPQGACPPAQLNHSRILNDPDFLTGADATDGFYYPALSAVWWWENKKFEDPLFGFAANSSPSSTAAYVTKRVKGSGETADRREKLLRNTQSCVK